MDDKVKIQLRDELEAMKSFEERLNHLEAFCIKHDVKNLSELRFYESIPGPFEGTSYNANNLVPMVSETIEQRITFNQWVMEYYKQIHFDASFDGLKEHFYKTLANVPYQSRFIEQELNDYRNREKSWSQFEGFLKGYREEVAGASLNLTRSLAYETSFLYELKGRAIVHYIPFLENQLAETNSASQPKKEKEGPIKPLNYFFRDKAKAQKVKERILSRSFDDKGNWAYGDKGNFIRAVIAVLKEKNLLNNIKGETLGKSINEHIYHFVEPRLYNYKKNLPTNEELDEARKLLDGF